MRCAGWGMGLGVAAMIVASAAGRSQGTLIGPALYAVEGAPFSATIELVWEGNGKDDPGRRVSRVMRDSAGRQRFEMPAVDAALAAGQAPVVTIYDVPGGKIFKLDVAHQTATVQTMTHVGRTVTTDLAARRGFPCHAPEDRELLGVTTVAGLEACGQGSGSARVGDDGDLSYEHTLWLSTSYLMPVMEHGNNATRGKWTQKVIELDPREPDQALFVVPPGYEIKDGAGPEPAVPRGIAASAAPATGVTPGGGKVSPPAVLFAPEPQFSEEARQAKVGGNVLVYLQVDENGNPKNVRVLRGVGMGLDQKAVEAVKRYKFRPATQDGHPVTVEMNVQVNFQIFKSKP